MKLLTMWGALALGLAAPALPALAADPPAGMVAVEGALRHEATGVTLPDAFNGWSRVVTDVHGVTALYMPKDLGDMLKGKAAIMGIDRLEGGVPTYAQMREAAAGSFHETGTPQILEENSFAWPGHPDAVTFHGVYTVGPYRKDYWRGFDQGWNAMVIVTTPRGDKKLGDRLSKLVASDVYGGATLEEAPGP
jgi:hypothetical protein